jgi:beta-lactamase regulating signal transducer with metallopeptidase domain
MTGALTWWLADFYMAASILLAGAALAVLLLRQPARRLTLAWTTLGGVIALAVLTCLAGAPQLGLGLLPGPHGAGHEEWLQYAFLAGSSLAAAWLLLGAIQAAVLLRGSRSATPPLQTLLTSVVGDRPLPRLLVSDQLDQPVALGTLRPTIVVPARWEAEASPRHLEAALAHEWAHLRHSDLWVLALVRLLLPLLFAHPLYWWLRGQMRLAQELRADAVAAARIGLLDYAAALLHWARQGSRQRLRAAALALGERPSQLKRRIAALLDPQSPSAAPCSPRWNLAAAVLIGLSVQGLSLVTLRPLSETETQPAGNLAQLPTERTTEPSETPASTERSREIRVTIALAPLLPVPDTAPPARQVVLLSPHASVLLHWWQKQRAEWLYHLLSWWLAAGRTAR